LLNFGKNNKIKQFQIYKLDNWFFRGSKKVGDREYAYEITAYWDKKKQHSKQHSKYLGIVLDKEAGIFQEVKRRKRDLNGKVIELHPFVRPLPL